MPYDRKMCIIEFADHAHFLKFILSALRMPVYSITAPLSAEVTFLWYLASQPDFAPKSGAL